MGQISLLDLPEEILASVVAFSGTETAGNLCQASIRSKQLFNSYGSPPCTAGVASQHALSVRSEVMWAALLDQELGQVDTQRISSGVKSHLQALSSVGGQWEALTSRGSATAGYSRRHADSRSALKQQRALNAAQKHRNMLADTMRTQISSGVSCARAVRLVLDVFVGCGCNVLPALGALCTLAMLCAYLDGSLDVSGYAIMAPTAIGVVVGVLALAAALATELCSERTTDQPASPWHRQANASRFFLAGGCAFFVLQVCRESRSAGPTVYRRVKCAGWGVFLLLSGLALLQLLLLAMKIDDTEALTWGSALAPAFVVLTVAWCLPLGLPLDTEEKAAGAAACFCMFSLPLLLTAMLFVLRNDSDHNISVGGLFSPILVMLSVFLCGACGISLVAVQEGELEGNPAARAAFSVACSMVCCLAVAPVAFMALLIEVDQGDIVPVGLAPSVLLPVNASASNATMPMPVGVEEVSWFLVFIPLFCSGAFVCVAGAAQYLLVVVGAFGRSWRLQGDVTIPKREEEIFLYV